MKKIFTLLVILLLSIEMKGQYLLGVLNYSAYCTDKMEPYIEFQFLIDGKTTNYVLNEHQKYAAEVEITVNLKNKDASTPTDSAQTILHYILTSAEFEDSARKEKPYFMDVQNVMVPNGNYELYFNIKDLHDTTRPIRYIDLLQVYFPDDKISVSGISLWETFNATGSGGIFTKYGRSVTPLFQNYAPESVYALPITLEIYNTRKILGNDKEFIVKAAIIPAETYRSGNDNYVSYKKMKTDDVIPFLHQFNLFNLPSGNYNVVIDILNTDSVILSSATAFFQRSNPAVKLDLTNYDDVITQNTFVEKITDLNQMQDYTTSLYPIGSRIEQEFFNQRMKNVPLDRLQKFFYSFWMKRNPDDPEGAWNEYNEKVKYVQSRYGSTVIKGYRTDRGRVYLRYGEPTHITEEPFDTQAYPYEIWHYYVIGEQTNVKFVFYNRDLVSNNYELLHSDLIGETSDPAWQMKLVKRLDPSVNPDVTTPSEYWGGNAKDQYQYNK